LDILCPRCGEPWDPDYVQHEMTPEEREELLAGQGCCSECRMNPPADSDATAASRLILDLCPDDLDGAAALMKDMGLEP
jgi:hypothetical protein